MTCHCGPDHGPARLYPVFGWLCDACWTWLYLRDLVRLNQPGKRS